MNMYEFAFLLLFITGNVIFLFKTMKKIEIKIDAIEHRLWRLIKKDSQE